MNGWMNGYNTQKAKCQLIIHVYQVSGCGPNTQDTPYSLFAPVELAFDDISINSMDATGQRDFIGMVTTLALLLFWEDM